METQQKPPLDLQPLYTPVATILSAIMIAAAIYFGSHPGDATVKLPVYTCDKSNPLSADCLQSYASNVSLDTAKFVRCVKNEETVAEVQSDIDYAKKLGIKDVPALYLGKGQNHNFDGFAISAQTEKAVIQDMLTYLTSHTLEESQAYWLKQQLASIETFRGQVTDYFKTDKGGNLSGDTLEREVTKLVQQQRAAIESNAEIIKLSDENGEIRGNGEIVLMAFGDYECAPCRDFVTKVLPDLLEGLVAESKVRIVYRDYILEDVHHNARKAAEAARCAGNQNQYFEYQKQVMLNQ